MYNRKNSIISTKKDSLKEDNNASYSPEMIIDDSFYLQVAYLNKLMPSVEWSGVLFYTSQGSLKDKNLIIHLKEIYLLDVGNASTTSYIESEHPDYMQYLMKTPDNWERGTIHSHHGMSVFFSGTDMTDLKEFALAAESYLSVIVNVKGEILAKIGKKVKSTFSFIDDNGEILETQENESLFVYSCKNIIQSNLYVDLKEKFSILNKKKVEKGKLSVRERGYKDHFKENKKPFQHQTWKSNNRYSEIDDEIYAEYFGGITDVDFDDVEDLNDVEVLAVDFIEALSQIPFSEENGFLLLNNYFETQYSNKKNIIARIEENMKHVPKKLQNQITKLLKKW